MLTTIVHVATRHGESSFFLQVGGLISQTEEHVNWLNERPLNVGDNVQVKIVETDAADKPTDKYRLDPTS